MSVFRERAQEAGICFATTESMPPNADERQFDELIGAIRKHASARVVLCLCEGRSVSNLFAGFSRANLTNEFLVIGSDGWSDRFDVVRGVERVARGGISIRIHSSYVYDFDSYYFSLNPLTNLRNPWFAEFWEQRFKCNIEPLLARGREQQQQQLSRSSQHVVAPAVRPRTYLRAPGLPVYPNECTGRESLREDHKQDAKMAFVQKSIVTMAKGLDAMQRSLCGTRGLCPQMLPVNGSLLLAHLMNVSFEWLGERVSFDDQGDPPGRYEILNFQQQVQKQRYEYEHVGSWSSTSGLRLFGRIQWPAHHMPQSVCSLPCVHGHAKKIQSDSVRCCWVCVACRPNEYLANEFKCQACQKGWWPNAKLTGCEQIAIDYVRWTSRESLLSIGVAALGFTLTVCVMCVFVRHNDTPVVKSSTRELSYMILGAMLLCYANTLFLVATPTRITCLATRILPGLAFATIYGALVTKTNRIARILAGSKKKILTRKPRFMSAAAQVCITWMMILIECCIIGVMLWREPANTALTYPSDERVVLVCNTTTMGIIAPLGFDLFLIAMCTVYAVKTRNVPENFNEAKFIGSTMYTTLVIWIAFIPIYFGSDHKVTALCLCITFSALIALILLFFPRCYIILLKPEKNNRSFFTTAKNVRCHIGYPANAVGPSLSLVGNAPAAALVPGANHCHQQQLSSSPASDTVNAIDAFSNTHKSYGAWPSHGPSDSEMDHQTARWRQQSTSDQSRPSGDADQASSMNNNTVEGQTRRVCALWRGPSSRSSSSTQQQQQQQQSLENQMQAQDNNNNLACFSDQTKSNNSSAANNNNKQEESVNKRKWRQHEQQQEGREFANSTRAAAARATARGSHAESRLGTLVALLGGRSRQQKKRIDRASNIEQHLKAIRRAEMLDRQTHTNFRRSRGRACSFQRFDSASGLAATINNNNSTPVNGNGKTNNINSTCDNRQLLLSTNNNNNNNNNNSLGGNQVKPPKEVQTATTTTLVATLVTSSTSSRCNDGTGTSDVDISCASIELSECERRLLLALRRRIGRRAIEHIAMLASGTSTTGDELMLTHNTGFAQVLTTSAGVSNNSTWHAALIEALRRPPALAISASKVGGLMSSPPAIDQASAAVPMLDNCRNSDSPAVVGSAAANKSKTATATAMMMMQAGPMSHNVADRKCAMHCERNEDCGRDEEREQCVQHYRINLGHSSAPLEIHAHTLCDDTAPATLRLPSPQTGDVQLMSSVSRTYAYQQQQGPVDHVKSTSRQHCHRRQHRHHSRHRAVADNTQTQYSATTTEDKNMDTRQQQLQHMNASPDTQQREQQHCLQQKRSQSAPFASDTQLNTQQIAARLQQQQQQQHGQQLDPQTQMQIHMQQQRQSRSRDSSHSRHAHRHGHGHAHSYAHVHSHGHSHHRHQHQQHQQHQQQREQHLLQQHQQHQLHLQQKQQSGRHLVISTTMYKSVFSSQIKIEKITTDDTDTFDNNANSDSSAGATSDACNNQNENSPSQQQQQQQQISDITPAATNANDAAVKIANRKANNLDDNSNCSTTFSETTTSIEADQKSQSKVDQLEQQEATELIPVSSSAVTATTTTKENDNDSHNEEGTQSECELQQINERSKKSELAKNKNEKVDVNVDIDDDDDDSSNSTSNSRNCFNTDNSHDSTNLAPHSNATNSQIHTNNNNNSNNNDCKSEQTRVNSSNQSLQLSRHRSQSEENVDNGAAATASAVAAVAELSEQRIQDLERRLSPHINNNGEDSASTTTTTTTTGASTTPTAVAVAARTRARLARVAKSNSSSNSSLNLNLAKRSKLEAANMQFHANWNANTTRAATHHHNQQQQRQQQHQQQQVSTSGSSGGSSHNKARRTIGSSSDTSAHTDIRMLSSRCQSAAAAASSSSSLGSLNALQALNALSVLNRPVSNSQSQQQQQQPSSLSPSLTLDEERPMIAAKRRKQANPRRISKEQKLKNLFLFRGHADTTGSSNSNNSDNDNDNGAREAGNKPACDRLS
ncbi:Metabotropic glutamate receptor 5, partial [Fragariocoptes setiger]